MAKGSHAGWDGLPAEKRVCAKCGAKLTLKEAGGLDIRFFPTRYVTHMDCARAATVKL